jgi:predicted Zn-dependent protease
MGASTMDGQLGRRFFLDPQLAFQRRYEALRAVIAEDRPVTEVAARFGYKPAALSVMISRFNSQLRSGSVPPFFLLTDADAHRGGGAAKI